MALVKYNNRSILNVTALDSMASGDMNLITTNTISSGVSSSSFTSNINSTYNTYIFKFINMHPASDSVQFSFNFSTDGSNFNVTKTSSSYSAQHNEAGNDSSIPYEDAGDLAQSTGYQIFNQQVGNDNDQCISGILYLFDPSNTTFVKHYLAEMMTTHPSEYSIRQFVGGYNNTTSAITAVDFKFSSGNIDSGVIKMYGLSKS